MSFMSDLTFALYIKKVLTTCRDYDDSHEAATFSNGTTYLGNMWSLISASVLCIKSSIIWEIRCKGVENKLAM